MNAMSSSEDLLIGMEGLGVSINSKTIPDFPNMDSGAESPSTLHPEGFQQKVPMYEDGTVTNTGEKANIIICSDNSLDEAHNLQNQQQTQHRIHVCRAVDDLTELSSDTQVYKEMWIIVDSHICDLFLRRRSFHAQVEDFFETFAIKSKVRLIKRLPDSEVSKFQSFRWQLPEQCVLEYTELDISSGLLSKEEFLMTRDGPRYQQDLEKEDEYSESRARDSEDESGDGDQEMAEGEAKYVQIGSKSQMYVKTSNQTWTVMKQEGTQNTMVLQIVVRESTSKVVVNVITDPRNQRLEEEIESIINQETEVINVILKDASIVAVKRGSVIIEIEVQPGQNIGSNWLQHMIESIFTEKVRACIPSGHRLNFEITSNITVPLADLGRYLSENVEEFHENYVSKEKYEQMVSEVEELERELNPMGMAVMLASGDITDIKQEKRLRDAVEHILSIADCHGNRTISFLPVGTGIRHFDTERVSHIITDVYCSFTWGSLQEAWLVYPDRSSTSAVQTCTRKLLYDQPDSHREPKPSASMISAPTKRYGPSTHEHARKHLKRSHGYVYFTDLTYDWIC
ncbi:uncharacterized protein [Haliotis asinina]|uniref:uncharacterized protein n=1 Tax=Haliotis asinina TaxID=109174 RepID=UPI003531EB60